MKPHFSQEKRSHVERCRLISKVAIDHDENEMKMSLYQHISMVERLNKNHFACENFDSLWKIF